MFYLSLLNFAIDLEWNKEIIAARVNEIGHFRSLSSTNIIITAYILLPKEQKRLSRKGSKDLAWRLLAKYSRVSGVVLLHRSIIHRVRNSFTNRASFVMYV